MALVTVSGNIKNSLGVAVPNAVVAFQLVNYGSNVPVVSGTNVLVPTSVTITADGTGAFSGSIQGNDTITPTNTLYQVTFAGTLIGVYSLTGATANLNTLASLSNTAVSIGGVPANFLTSNNIFSGSNTFSQQIIANAAIGTAPFSVASTTPVTNLTLFADTQLPTISTAGKINVSALTPVTGTGNAVLSVAPTLSAKNLNNVQFADQFAGADCGARINAADVALGTTAGEIWVNQACGLTISTTISLSANHVLRFIQGGTWTYTATPAITCTGDNIGIFGTGWNGTVLQTSTPANSGINCTGRNNIRIQGLALKQTGATPTGQGIIFNGGGKSFIRDVFVSGFQDGISITSYSPINIEDTNIQSCSRDGLRLIGTNLSPTINPYISNLFIQSNGGTGLVIDGNIGGGTGLYIFSALNSTGVSFQTSLGTGIPSQWFLYGVQADSNTTTGWTLDSGTQINLVSPWSSNRGTGKNFKIGAVTNVYITNPFLYNFVGHGMEITAGATAVKIEGAYVNDNNVNTLNSFDGININNTTATPATILISNSIIGNPNLRYGVNISTGPSFYTLIGNQIAAGGSGRFNDVSLAPSRVILGNSGIQNFLPDALSSLSVTGNVVLGNISTISTSGVDNSLTLSQTGPLKIPTGNVVLGNISTFSTSGLDNSLSLSQAGPTKLGNAPFTIPNIVGTAAAFNVAQTWTGNQTNMALVTPTISGVATLTGEAVLTGSANPVLDYEPAAFTTSQFFDARPAPWQIIRGTTTSPIGNGIPSILINQVSNGTFTSGADASSLNSGIKVHHVIAGGTTMSGASAGDFNLEDRVVSNVRGTGPAAIHAEAISAVASGDVFGIWVQAFDTGLNSGIAGIEVDVDGTFAGRTDSQTRGMNVVEFAGAGTTAASSGDISNDWGILVQNFGNGIIYDPGLPGFAASTRKFLRVRNTSNATGNANTTILAFEAAQPGPFNFGLDFRNATFTNGALVTASSEFISPGKIRRVAGTNNLVGAIGFTAVASASATFTNPYVNPPICVGASQGDPGVGVRGPWMTSTTTTVTANFSATVTGNVNYICMEAP